MVNEDDRPGEGEPDSGSFDASSAELSKALDDLLAGDGDDGDTPSPPPPPPSPDAGGLSSSDLDLSALEEAVAELGLDVDEADAAADTPPPPPPAQAADGPRTIEVGDTPKPTNPGLDLTELPTPSGPPERKLPPLGEATADDLFGPLDDDPGLPSTWDDGPEEATPPPPAPAKDVPPPPPPAAEASHDAAAEAGSDPDPISLPAPEPPPPAADADPSMGDVVGFTAHGGTITGNIRAKTKKLFGRG